MSEKILSPDGKQEWNGTKWVPISEKSPSISGTTEKMESIVNFANVSLDALERVDMAGAKKYYEMAKEIDFKIATRIFEQDYAFDFARRYADIVESYLVGIIETNIRHNSTYHGMGVISWDINGDIEVDVKLDRLNMAFDNAVSFLGEPESMISASAARVNLVFFESFDEDGDGIPDFFQSEVVEETTKKKEKREKRNCAVEGCMALEYRREGICNRHMSQGVEIPKPIDVPKPKRKSKRDFATEKPVLTKEMIESENIELIDVPDEEITKQQYRIGLCMMAAAVYIRTKLEPILYDVSGTGNAVTLEFLFKKLRNAGESYDKGRLYYLSALAVALKADFPVDKWESEDFKPLHINLDISMTTGRYQDMIEEMLNRQKQEQESSECFIATAAYGTPYDSKINVLRNWRDECLQSSILGRMFIRNYYFFSPPIASIVAKSTALRGIVRLILFPIIHILKPKYSRPRNSRSRYPRAGLPR